MNILRIKKSVFFRCASTQTTIYTGKRCEEVSVHIGVVGALIAGAAGTVILTLAIFTVLRGARCLLHSFGSAITEENVGILL